VGGIRVEGEEIVMREEIRQFVDGLSKEEQAEIVHTLVARWAEGVTEERTFLGANDVVVGYFVPYAKWVESHPPMTPPVYRTQEEASEAARNGRSPSEIVAWLNANYPAEAPGPDGK
jgi:hypothetical protein